MTRTLSPEHKKAMQVGRRKAGAKRRKERIDRVRTYLRWLNADRSYRDEKRHAESVGEPFRKKPPMIPTIPSDEDYAVARSEGAINGR